MNSRTGPRDPDPGFRPPGISDLFHPISSHSWSLVFFSILILIPPHSSHPIFSFYCFLIRSPYILLHLFPFHNHAFLSALIYSITFYRTFGLHLFSYSFPHISFIILPYHSSSIPIPYLYTPFPSCRLFLLASSLTSLLFFLSLPFCSTYLPVCPSLL